jgi:hypothetical protein
MMRAVTSGGAHPYRDAHLLIDVERRSRSPGEHPFVIALLVLGALRVVFAIETRTVDRDAIVAVVMVVVATRWCLRRARRGLRQLRVRGAHAHGKHEHEQQRPHRTANRSSSAPGATDVSVKAWPIAVCNSPRTLLCHRADLHDRSSDRGGVFSSS